MATGRTRRLGRMSWPPVLALVLAVLFVSPVLAPSERRPDGDAPEDLGSFTGGLEALGYDVRTSVVTPAAGARWVPTSTLIVLLGPTEPITGAEARWLASWTRDGGRLLVADGLGSAHEVFAALDVPTRPLQVFQAGVDRERDALSVPARLSGTAGPHDVVLRAPMVIDDVQGTSPASWTPLARTGNESFLDLDGDARLDEGDTRGPFVVAAAAAQGRAVLVTDGWMFTNEGLAAGDNRAAVDDLLSILLPEGGTVIVDVSHAAHAGPGELVLSGARPVVGTAQLAPWSWIAPVALAMTLLVVSLARATRPGPWLRYAHDPDQVHAPDPGNVDRTAMERELAALAQGEGGAGRPGARARPTGSSRTRARRQALHEALGALGATARADAEPTNKTTNQETSGRRTV